MSQPFVSANAALSQSVSGKLDRVTGAADERGEAEDNRTPIVSVKYADKFWSG